MTCNTLCFNRKKKTKNRNYFPRYIIINVYLFVSFCNNSLCLNLLNIINDYVKTCSIQSLFFFFLFHLHVFVLYNNDLLTQFILTSDKIMISGVFITMLMFKISKGLNERLTIVNFVANIVYGLTNCK